MPIFAIRKKSTATKRGVPLIKNAIRKLIFKEKADSASYVKYLRKKGMRIGEGSVIYAPKTVFIDDTRPWMIEIGNHVKITQGTIILTHGFDWAVMKGVYGEVLGSCGKVTIGNNVFIGMNTVILKNVTVGNNVIIGAGSLVNKDIPDNCVVAGNPAKVIMTLEEYHKKRLAAQEKEAAEMVREYRKVYGKDPGEPEFSEFFWLFTDHAQELPEAWDFHMSIGGNGAYSKKLLAQNKKHYKDMADFLNHC